MLLLIVITVIVLMGYGLVKRKGGFVYAAFALCAAALSVIPIGYTMIHGGEVYIGLVPLLVLLVFSLPYLCKKLFPLSLKLQKIALWLPVFLVVVPLFLWLMVIPSYQEHLYKSKLEKVRVSNVRVTPITSNAKVITGVHVRFQLSLPEAFHVAKDSNDFSPISFPAPYVSFEQNGESKFEVVDRKIIKVDGAGKEEVVADPSYLKDILSGSYVVDFNARAQGIALSSDGHDCFVKAYMDSTVQAMERFSAVEPVLNVVSEVNMPNRMGSFSYSMATQKLPIKIPISQFISYIRSLPDCAAK